MKRPRATEARAILQDELSRVGWAAESAFTIEDGFRPGTESLDWWHARTPANESSDTLRNLAYLRAYLRISGGPVLYAGGLRLDRRTLWMDRSVISRLERDGYLAFDDKRRPPAFMLSDKGREWTAQGGWTFSELQVSSLNR